MHSAAGTCKRSLREQILSVAPAWCLPERRCSAALNGPRRALAWVGMGHAWRRASAHLAGGRGLARAALQPHARPLTHCHNSRRRHCPVESEGEPEVNKREGDRADWSKKAKRGERERAAESQRWRMRAASRRSWSRRRSRRRARAPPMLRPRACARSSIRRAPDGAAPRACKIQRAWIWQARRHMRACAPWRFLGASGMWPGTRARAHSPLCLTSV